MGVTHKLKQEVIDFIVDQKNQNPKLGCRKLADLTSEKFNTKVSKSSVNTILKNAELSNSVGRPSKKLDDKAKKFQIPSEKKQQISKELHNIPIPKEEQSKKIEKLSNLPESKSIKEDILDIPSPRNIKKTTEFKRPDLEIDLTSETIKIANAGAVLFKAAFWECIDQALLGSIFQRYNMCLEKNEFDKACSLALTLLGLGVHYDDNISEDTFRLIEILEGSRNIKSSVDLLSKEVVDGERRDLITRIELETQQLLNYAGCVLIKLNNGKEVYLNPYLTSVSTRKSDVLDGAPLKCTLDILSEFLISNNKPIILPYTSAEDDSVYNLIGFLENLENYQASSIIVEGNNQGILAKFSILPTKRRIYAVGLAKEDPDLAKLTKSAQWATKERHISQYGDVAYDYCVTQANFIKNKLPDADSELKIVTVWEEGAEAPVFSALTNLSCDYKLLIDKYLYKIRNNNTNTTKDLKSCNRNVKDFVALLQKNENLSVKNVLELISKFLEEFVVNEYFQSEDLKTIESDVLSKVYNISGEMIVGKQNFIVNLEKPDDKNLYNLVKKVVNKISQRNIITSKMQYFQINI